MAGKIDINHGHRLPPEYNLFSLFLSSFNNIFSAVPIIQVETWSGKVIVNDKLMVTWKEAVIAWFKVLS
jgi:hypothetical protein